MAGLYVNIYGNFVEISVQVHGQVLFDVFSLSLAPYEVKREIFGTKYPNTISNTS